MRILKIAFILLFLLAILAGVCVPWIVGNTFKTQYYATFESMQNTVNSSDLAKKAQFKFKIDQYEQNWLTTDIKASSSFAPLDKSGVAAHTYEFTVTEHVIHGPLIYNPLKHRWVIAQALIKMTVHAPKEFDDMYFGDKPNQGIIQAQSILDFNNTYHNVVKVAGYHHTTPNGVQIDWNGMTGTSVISLRQNNSLRMIANMMIEGVTINGSTGKLISQNAIVKYNISTDSAGAYRYAWNISFPGYDLTSNKLTSSLRNLQMTSTTQVTPKLSGQKLHIALDQLVIPQYTVNQSNFDLDIQDLSTPGINNLFIAANNYSQGQHTDEERMQYLAALPQLFTPTTRISGNSTVNIASDKVVTDWVINWPNGVTKLSDIAKSADVTVNIRMSANLVNQFVDYIGQQMQAKQQSEAQTNPVAVTSAANKPITLNLPPAQISQLVKPTPADQAKQQFNAYLTAGFIKQDGNDFVTKITVQNGVVKANDLPVQP